MSDAQYEGQEQRPGFNEQQQPQPQQLQHGEGEGHAEEASDDNNQGEGEEGYNESYDDPNEDVELPALMNQDDPRRMKLTNEERFFATDNPRCH